MSNRNPAAPSRTRSPITLARDLGLLALVATAVCNVIGAGINYLTLGIQQKVPGIGPHVPLAVIITGAATTPDEYAAAFDRNPGTGITDVLDRAEAAQAEQSPGTPFRRDYRGIEAQVSREAGPPVAVPLAVAWLFFAYIGFAGISQAGGETRNPRRVLPRAFLIATAVICGYYLLFSWAVYHAFGWRFVAGFVAASGGSANVPLLIGIVMPPVLAAFVALMAALALANDIPPMLLATSRLFFAWARDGIFPRGLAAINRRFHTPHWALTACALVASGFVIACFLWQSYFDAVDTVVVALTFTYLLVAISVLTLPKRNPDLAAQVSFIRSRPAQIVLAILAIVFLLPLLIAVPFLQGRATMLFWLAVMGAGALLFAIMWQRAKARGEDLGAVFAVLPTTAEEAELPPTAIGRY